VKYGVNNSIDISIIFPEFAKMLEGTGSKHSLKARNSPDPRADQNYSALSPKNQRSKMGRGRKELQSFIPMFTSQEKWIEMTKI